jgi:sugar phosphate isomerase/epimerase
MAPESDKSLGMSTSWNGAGYDDGRRIVDEITRLGFRTIEVEYRVSESAIPGIESAVKAGEVEVVSIHNFAPRPTGEPATDWGGDRLSLASPDEPERKEAVRLTVRSIGLARRLGAKAVVVHMGEVDTGRGYFKELAELVEAEGAESPGAKRLRADITEARDRRKGRFLDATLRSLKDLVEPAGQAGLTVCMENRYFRNQIPLPDEVTELMKSLAAAPVRYWHDVGHAHVQEVLGFGPQVGTITALRPYLFGAHIHDSRFVHDHRAPGMGEIDLARILSLIPDNALRILELAPVVAEAEVRHALAYLGSLDPPADFV